MSEVAREAFVAERIVAVPGHRPDLSACIAEVASTAPLDVSCSLRGNPFLCSKPEGQGCSLPKKPEWAGSREPSRAGQYLAAELDLCLDPIC